MNLITRNKKDRQLVTIAIVSQPHNASILSALLENEGITVFLQDEIFHQLYMNASGGIKIQVPESESERAYDLLTETGYDSCLIK